MTVTALAPKTHEASVVSIKSARSFAGRVHEPEWTTFTVACHDDAAATRFVQHLSEHSLHPTRDGVNVSVRFDKCQPTQRALPNEIAFAAVALSLANAENILDSLVACTA